MAREEKVVQSPNQFLTSPLLYRQTSWLMADVLFYIRPLVYTDHPQYKQVKVTMNRCLF